MADLSKEWCLNRAHQLSLASPRHPDLELQAQALRITARVLDEGAVERLARVIDEHCKPEMTYKDDLYLDGQEEAAQAVINYLLEGEE